MYYIKAWFAGHMGYFPPVMVHCTDDVYFCIQNAREFRAAGYDVETNTDEIVNNC